MKNSPEEPSTAIDDILRELFVSQVRYHVENCAAIPPEHLASLMNLAERIEARSTIEQLRVEVQELRDAIADVATKVGLTRIHQSDGWERPR